MEIGCSTFIACTGSSSCIVGMNVVVRRGHTQTNEIYRFGGSVDGAQSHISINEPIHGFHGFYGNCISALGVYSILQEQGSCSENDTHCSAGTLCSELWPGLVFAVPYNGLFVLLL